MAKHDIKIHQIYFKREHLGFISPGCYSYFNKQANKFLENQVIKDLVSHGHNRECEYFGVLSWKFSRKVGFSYDYMKSLIYQDNFSHDVYSFFSRVKHMNIWRMGDKWHKDLSKIGQMLINKIGIECNVSDLDTTPVYCNYWIAKTDIFSDYVNTMLTPALKILSTDKEIMFYCDKNSNYTNLDMATPQMCKQIFGKPYYTYYPFILERLPSTYFALNDIRVKHLA